MAPHFRRTNKINGLKGQISTEGDVWQTVIRNSGSRGTEDVKTNECVRDGGSRKPPLSGAGLRIHGGSVCVLPKASIHYLRGHKLRRENQKGINDIPPTLQESQNKKMTIV